MAEFVNHFSGTAALYARYRPGYPESVYDFISEMAGLESATSSILDLGCGPGIIALALADRASSVFGVDPAPDMIAQAEVAARSRGFHNVKWLCATAEEFGDEARTYDLITIGSAFHWMKRELVAERVHRLLRPRGVLAAAGRREPVVPQPAWAASVKMAPTPEWISIHSAPSSPAVHA